MSVNGGGPECFTAKTAEAAKANNVTESRRKRLGGTSHRPVAPEPAAHLVFRRGLCVLCALQLQRSGRMNRRRHPLFSASCRLPLPLALLHRRPSYHTPPPRGNPSRRLGNLRRRCEAGARPDPHSSGLLKYSRLVRLLKKTQMQGAARSQARAVLRTYVAAPREHGNAADGSFSAAC